MKVDAIRGNYYLTTTSPKRITAPSVGVSQKNMPLAVAFKSGNPKHLFHQISEISIFGQGSGGVGTVGNDLFFNIKDFDRVIQNIPLYNQEVVYVKELGENGQIKQIKPDGVKPRRIPKNLPADHPFKAYEGSVFITNMQIGPGTNLVEELAKPANAGKVFILDEIGSSTMHWGIEKDVPISIFKARKDERLVKFLREKKGWTDEMINKIDITFTYVDATASMMKPYADGSYSFAKGEDAIRNISVNWQGKPYPKEAKATAELMPLLKDKMSGFDPKFVVCHDGQAMPLIQFIAEKNAQGLEYYKDKSITAYGHNLCDGYMYDMGVKDAIVCLAKPGEIEKIVNSKEYIDALKAGQEEKFLTSLLPKELLNARSQTNAVMFPIAYGDKGYVPMFTTVSDGYYKSIISNEEVSPALYARLKSLSEKGRFRGIMNVLMDPMTSGFTVNGLQKYYKEDCKIKLADGKEVVLPKFLAFDEAKKYDLKSMREVKKHNKISLLKRLNKDFEGAQLWGAGKDKTMQWLDKGTGFSAAVTGDTGRSFNILGGIDQKFAQMLEKGQDVPVFVSWGRGDFQKGMDTGVEAFAKYVKKTGDKNSVYIFGGDMTNIRENITAILEKYSGEGGILKGRIVCLDGWAPGNSFVAAGDYSVLPSRFAPCELTDLESMKKGCIPIVPKVQGMDQKVFDPTDAVHKDLINGYKGKHEYFMPEKEALEAANAEAKKSFSFVKNKLVKDITKDYTLKTGEASVPEEFLLKELQKNKEYREALIKLRDSVIADEMAESIERAVKDRNTDVANKIWKNHVDLKTTWEENGVLNPGNKSTGQLTRELHFNPSYGQNLNPGEELHLNMSVIKDGSEKVKSKGIMKKLGEFIKKPVGKLTLGIIGAAAIVGGYAAFKSSHKSKPEVKVLAETPVENTADVDEEFDEEV